MGGREAVVGDWEGSLYVVVFSQSVSYQGTGAL